MTAARAAILGCVASVGKNASSAHVIAVGVAIAGSVALVGSSASSAPNIDPSTRSNCMFICFGWFERIAIRVASVGSAALLVGWNATPALNSERSTRGKLADELPRLDRTDRNTRGKCRISCVVWFERDLCVKQ